MINHRFGRKVRLHSTAAIKHQILTLMLEDEIRAAPGNSTFQAHKSPAIAALEKLRDRGHDRFSYQPAL
jgi:hypothetical protein